MSKKMNENAEQAPEEAVEQAQDENAEQDRTPNVAISPAIPTRAPRTRAPKKPQYIPPSEDACKKPGTYKLPSGITAVNA